MRGAAQEEKFGRIFCVIAAEGNRFGAHRQVDAVEFFEREVKPALNSSGASILATLVTEHSKNTFPKLPVREGENVFVWFARFADEAAYDKHVEALAISGNDGVADKLAARLSTKPEVLRLAPTSRSLL